MQRLAKMLPMSVPATSERVQRLEEAGVITGYTACVDPVKLGMSVNAFILCSLRIGELNSNIRWAQNEPRIIEAYTLAGRYSLLLRVSCKSIEEYHDLINTLYTCSVIESCTILNNIKDVGCMLEEFLPQKP